MHKIQKTKLIAIIALTLAICGMTLGFAAFSATLTISSSAIVTPKPEDFSLEMHGLIGENLYADLINIDNYSGTTMASVFDNNTGELIQTEIAQLDNDNLSISMNSINLKSPGDAHTSIIRIKNTGSYDAYFDTEQLNRDLQKTCQASTGTSQDLVDSACDYIDFTVVIGTEEKLEAEREYTEGEMNRDKYEEIQAQDCFFNRNGICKLEKEKSVFLAIFIGYSNGNNVPLADGDFSISFEDLELKFTSNDGAE